jgi:serine/threonine-protein kinase
MEKVVGEALSKTLQRWRVPVRYACDTTMALLDTLDSVHRAGLIHRDLKPSNLLVDLRPEAVRPFYLIDFGIAKAIQPDSALPDITRHGTLIGTPHYMAPEQIAGRADVRSDLYAAGVVFYEMLSGCAPFAGHSLTGVLASILCEPVPPLSSIRKGLPPSLLAVVEKATARAPTARFQSAREMQRALGRAIDDVLALGPRPDFEAMALVQPTDDETLATTERGEHARPAQIPTVTAIPRRNRPPRGALVTRTKTLL